MKYLAEVHIKNVYTGKFDQGTYARSFDDLDTLREWAKSVGKTGDELMILRNGDKLGNARKIII